MAMFKISKDFVKKQERYWDFSFSQSEQSARACAWGLANFTMSYCLCHKYILILWVSKHFIKNVKSYAYIHYIDHFLCCTCALLQARARKMTFVRQIYITCLLTLKTFYLSQMCSLQDHSSTKFSQEEK